MIVKWLSVFDEYDNDFYTVKPSKKSIQKIFIQYFLNCQKTKNASSKLFTNVPMIPSMKKARLIVYWSQEKTFGSTASITVVLAL